MSPVDPYTSLAAHKGLTAVGTRLAKRAGLSAAAAVSSRSAVLREGEVEMVEGEMMVESEARSTSLSPVSSSWRSGRNGSLRDDVTTPGKKEARRRRSRSGERSDSDLSELSDVQEAEVEGAARRRNGIHHRSSASQSSISTQEPAETGLTEEAPTSETERLSQIEPSDSSRSASRAPSIDGSLATISARVAGAARRHSVLSSDLSDLSSWARHTDEEWDEGKHAADIKEHAASVDESVPSVDAVIEDAEGEESDMEGSPNDADEKPPLDGDVQSTAEADGDLDLEDTLQPGCKPDGFASQEQSDADVSPLKTPKALAASRRLALLAMAREETPQGEDDETPAGTPAASVHEDEGEGPQSDRQAALESLRLLEEAFNLVKETLMVQKFRHFDWEVRRIEADIHPDVPCIDKLLRERRDARIKSARLKLGYSTQTCQATYRSSAHQAKCGFANEKTQLRRRLMEEYTRKRRKLESERRAIEVPRPVREAPSRLALDQVNTMKILEVETARDVLQRFGWPGAPGVSSARAEEAMEDLMAIERRPFYANHHPRRLGAMKHFPLY